VVVDLGKAQVFVRKVAQFFQRSIDANAAAGNLLQKQSQLLVDSTCLRISLTDYSIGTPSRRQAHAKLWRFGELKPVLSLSRAGTQDGSAV
jgi:hypothetical protein